MIKSDRRQIAPYVLSVALLFAFAHSARASGSFSLTLSSSYPTGYTFYSYTATDGSTQSNVPVAPYPATVNQPGVYTNQSAYAVCFDLNNPSNIGTIYTGTLAYNTDLATMESTYLMNQLNLDGMASAATSIKGAISMAIWAIMFPSSTKTDGTYFPADPAAASWEAQAAQAVQSGLWTVADSNLYPTFIPDDTTTQRFGLFLTAPIQVQQLSSTPEPGTITLLLAGIGL